jgi:DNA-binding protein HU-beta|tara:strand:+ start:141 stop:428 length:288 start_codon:yes stop_codon:yes gene_type:complete
MKKLDLINKISNNCNIDKNSISFVVESFMNEVKNSLNDGENVYLRGFGTFAVKKRAEKTARNITKNTIIKVPSHNVPTFKACKSFKNGVSKQNPC